MNRRQHIGRILQDTKKILSFHESLGVENYPCSSELKSFMERKIPEAAVSSDTHKINKKAAGPEEGQTVAVSLDKQDSLKDIRQEMGDCTRCSLHENRSRIMFGSGNPKANLMIIGEWPSFTDDSEGVLFSGPEGELLAKMLNAIGLDYEEVYLTNVLKCRASEENIPTPKHVRECLPFLLSQIDVISPKVICTMGPLAAQALLRSNKMLIRLRGKFHDLQGRPLLPTYHPSFLIKNPEMKKAAWYDLQLIQQKL